MSIKLLKHEYVFCFFEGGGLSSLGAIEKQTKVVKLEKTSTQMHVSCNSLKFLFLCIHYGNMNLL